MLLTIATDRNPATDLGYLLHKHPDRWQTFPLAYGSATVFYPQATAERCVACLLLHLDSVGMARRRGSPSYRALAQYVNDRPFVASSLMSVAIGQVFGTALQGKCQAKPGLAESAIPLEARIDVIRAHGGESFLRGVFEPLGYFVETARATLDDRFPEWGESPYFHLVLRRSTTLAELLAHLYVLIPVFDNQKHYYVGEAEVEKLLAKGKGWLSTHPLKEQITRRYLRHRASLYREALERLLAEEAAAEEESTAETSLDADEPVRLHEERLGAVLGVIRSAKAKRVLDLGCGEGKLLSLLLQDREVEYALGVDVSIRSLDIAARRLKLERLPEAQSKRIELKHGSLMYRDRRLEGFDAAAAVEVIEHLDPPRLTAFERVVFEFARPRVVVLTTPNREYNRVWESLAAGKLRHPDHRFEWTRDEFRSWATRVAGAYGYRVRFAPVGAEEPELGPPSQMGIFERD